MKNFWFYVLTLSLLLSGCANADKGPALDSSDSSAGADEQFDVYDKNNTTGGGDKDKKEENPSSGRPSGGEDVSKKPGTAPISYSWPQNLPDFLERSSTIALIDKLSFAPYSGAKASECCHDFGRASKRAGVDNGVAELNKYFRYYAKSDDISDMSNAKKGFVKDINDTFIRYYTSKQAPLFLLDTREVRSEQNHSGGGEHDKMISSILIARLEPKGSSSAIKDPLTGSYFNIDQEYSFVEDFRPRYYVNPSTIRGNRFYAEFGQMTLPVPFRNIVLQLDVKDVHLEAVASFDATHSKLAYEEGSLYGYVDVDSVYEGLNEYVLTHCSCAEGAQPLFSQDRNKNWSASCDQTSFISCQEKLSDACMDLVFSSKEGKDLHQKGFCDKIPVAIQDAADIDTAVLEGASDTGKILEWNALSLGYQWSGRPVR